MTDNTEQARRQMIADGVAPEPGEQTWTTDQMREEFEVTGYLAPYTGVRRRSDGVRGTLMFRGGFGSTGERVYFGFKAD